MSQTSCIRRLPGTKFVIRREELLAISDNNDCAAQLLHLFEFWTNGKIAEQQRIRQYNQVAAKAGNPLLRDEGLWLYESIQNIQKGLLGGYSEKTIRNSLKFLEFEGFIKTKPSNIAWDRTKYYLLQIKAVNAALDKWDKERQQSDTQETADFLEPKTLENIEPVKLPQETLRSAETLENIEPVKLPQEPVELPLEAVKLPLEVEILPALPCYKKVDLISRSKEHTPPNPLKGEAALANATPAPYPSVCISQKQPEDGEIGKDTGGVAPTQTDQDLHLVAPQTKDSAHAENLSCGQNFAVVSSNKPNKRINTQKTQIKWECPGPEPEKKEFLKWKGGLLVRAGKTSKTEAECAALAWANKNLEEATVLYESWEREKLEQVQPTPEKKTLITVPDFATMSRAEHKALIGQFVAEGQEAFLAREVWHQDWLRFTKTYLVQLLKEIIPNPLAAKGIS